MSIISDKNAVNCGQCEWLSDCGGLDGIASIWGCFNHCVCTSCGPNCDLTCPFNPELFASRLKEIGGSFTSDAVTVSVPNVSFPEYVAKIHNGCSRHGVLKVPFVVIPIRSLIFKDGFHVYSRYESANDIRRAFRLSMRTRIIISCVDDDTVIEPVWQGLKYERLSQEIGKLKPSAVITPNFSFFIDDVPRIHTLYNRKRIVIAANILSEAGCRVIIPLNALTRSDWNFWYELLRENSSMTYVAKEFGTGLASKKAGTRAIEDLDRLQQRLNRPLHPVVVSGFQFMDLVIRFFDKFSLVESHAFIAAHKRKRMVINSEGLITEIHSPTDINAPLDALLESNIKTRLTQLSSMLTKRSDGINEKAP